MAERKYYIGSAGPYFFDDAISLNDPDNPGWNQGAFVTDGGFEANSARVGEQVVITVDLSNESFKRHFLQ